MTIQKLIWVIDGEFRIGPCNSKSAEYWTDVILERGGVPKFEVYREAV